MQHPPTIRYRGIKHKVMRAERINGRKYFLLHQLGSGGRLRYQALEPPTRVFEGQMRTIHVLPNSKETIERIRILSGVGESKYPVPRILDAQPRGESVYVVTTWIYGQSLRRYLNDVSEGNRPPISPYLAVQLFNRFANQLFQFSKRYCHGDIRPENVILSPDPHQLVLIDYGSAWRSVNANRRTPGDGFTRTYAAPELLAGEPANFRSDQFSATMLFFEMLTGDIPYDRLGGSVSLIADATQRPPFIPPSQLAPNPNAIPTELWPAIDEVARRGLALDPADRYPTGSAWIAATRDLFGKMQAPSSSHNKDGLIVRLLKKIAGLRVTRKS